MNQQKDPKTATNSGVSVDAIVRPVAVLFAREDSIYKDLLGCDVYDKKRNALLFDKDYPVIAHPPCRAWGNLRRFAKPEPGEKALALFAVDIIRKNGGILEHPRGSTLWKVKNLPRPGREKDKYGGYTIQVNQFWWGHRAAKATWLYIVGIEKYDLPRIPLKFGEPSHVVAWSRKRKGRRPHIGKAERERTPVDFAIWLCRAVEQCKQV